MSMTEGNLTNLLTIRNGNIPYVVQNERYASSGVSVLIFFARVSIVSVNSPFLQSHRQRKMAARFFLHGNHLAKVVLSGTPLHRPVQYDRTFLKPLSHWDATSSQWVCESIRQTVTNCRETLVWYRKVLTCIANSSRMGRQSFKHVILFCATKFIAKPSPSHRICREPVAYPSPTRRQPVSDVRKHIT